MSQIEHYEILKNALTTNRTNSHVGMIAGPRYSLSLSLGADRCVSEDQAAGTLHASPILYQHSVDDLGAPGVTAYGLYHVAVNPVDLPERASSSPSVN